MWNAVSKTTTKKDSTVCTEDRFTYLDVFRYVLVFNRPACAPYNLHASQVYTGQHVTGL